MENKDGASVNKERQRQRQVKRAKKREDRRKYGWNKKRRAENKAEAAQKRKALAQAAIVGGDAQAGLSKDSSGDYNYDPALGASMKSNQSGGGYNAKNPGAAAKQLMRNQKDGGSMYGKKHGSSMYGKKHGASMNAYQDKKASMDDYSHEKKLKADGRYEAAHGKMANAKNDFDHAHALKKDAHHDARSRISILKHMKRF